jgi:predicted small lipoprotein YifL
MRVSFARLPMLVIVTIAIVLPLVLTACGGKGGGY